MSEPSGSPGMRPRETFDHRTFVSVWTWRYGSAEMRRIWSEEHNRLLWRRVWIALARAQHRAGLVSDEELADLEAHAEDVDLARAHEIERATRHDVMAEIHAYAEQAPVGGRKLHLGATSTDVEDNVDALRIKESLELIERHLVALIRSFATQIERYASTTCMAYTHLQPAEPTTMGYRLSMYGQDLLLDLEQALFVARHVRAKGMKGAVGTAASYALLLAGRDLSPEGLEESVLDQLGMTAFEITGQTYPRKLDLLVTNLLACIAQSLYRFAFDLRIEQSPGFGELAEPFGSRQVGSSAMPFKRNPRTTERICSLGRYVLGLPAIAASNAAHSLLERTLDDSAARRIFLPEGLLAVDEMLALARHVVEGLVVDEAAITRNLNAYGPFAATEVLMLTWVDAYGASRQELHELIRTCALQAWQDVRAGRPNPLAELIANAAHEARIVPGTLEAVRGEVRDLLDTRAHVGTAPERAARFAETLRAAVQAYEASDAQEAPTY